ncbi:hypothetical protein KQI65_10290 [bacterium]|nr:hypothetical protein [bacterium]
MNMLPVGGMLTSASYRYGHGNTFLRGDSHTETGAVLSYTMHYLDLAFAYGIHARVTAVANLGFFPRKSQRFPDYTITGSGVSHVFLGGRYLLYRDEADGWDWNAGAGLRIPLSAASTNLPQHIDPSTGALGVSLRSHLTGSLSEDVLYLLFGQSFDISATNSAEYRYGPVLRSSIAFLCRVTEPLAVIAEIRIEHRWQDHFYDGPIDDSGMSTLVFSPQCAVRIGPLLFSPFFDYPLYRYYHGTQLANDMQAGFHLIWKSGEAAH